jgi:hypothetical protein
VSAPPAAVVEVVDGNLVGALSKLRRDIGDYGLPAYFKRVRQCAWTRRERERFKAEGASKRRARSAQRVRLQSHHCLGAKPADTLLRRRRRPLIHQPPIKKWPHYTPIAK